MPARHLSVCRSLLALSLLACAGPTPSPERTLQTRLARVLETYDVQGAVLVARAGATRFAAARGFADLETARLNSTRTVFRLGSVTKQFTAMAILLLQDRGALSTSDTVGHYLPDAPDAWRPLTLRQLLTHTSGLVHIWAVPGFRERMHESVTLDEALAQFREFPLQFVPGTQWAYSGVGYQILAKIIEVTSGESYPEFLQHAIFAPLGMQHSGAEDPARISEDAATPYLIAADGSPTVAPAIDLPVLTGGGNLVSTAEDMALWGEALRRRELLSSGGYRELFEPVLNGFACGWAHGLVDDTAMIWHSGGTPGTNTYVMLVPSAELWVVVLANREPTPVAAVAAALARELL